MSGAPETNGAVPHHVAATVESVAAIHARALGGVTRHQRGIEVFTRVLGRPRTIYTVAVCIAVWIAGNLAALAMGVRPIDPPPFPALQGAASVSALIVALMVLSTQNRQTHHAEQRAALDLQVNLLAEQKVTKLIAILDTLRRDVTGPAPDPEADAMKRAVDPEEVLTALEQTLEGGRLAK